MYKNTILQSAQASKSGDTSKKQQQALQFSMD